jgi:cystathionine beta-synthase
VAKAIYKQLKMVSLDTSLAQLSRIFQRDHFALAIASQRCYGPGNEETVKTVVFGVVTPLDLVNYVLQNNPNRRV